MVMGFEDNLKNHENHKNFLTTFRPTEINSQMHLLEKLFGYFRPLLRFVIINTTQIVTVPIFILNKRKTLIGHGKSTCSKCEKGKKMYTVNLNSQIPKIQVKQLKRFI